MSEVNPTASATAVVTLKVRVDKVGEEAKAYKAKAKIEAFEEDNKECYLTVTDVKADRKTFSVEVYSEDLTQKQGEEYLKAILWTERCSNGIHIMYYTPR